MIPYLKIATNKDTILTDSIDLILHAPIGLQELSLENLSFNNQIAIALVRRLRNLRRFSFVAVFNCELTVNFLKFIENMINLEFLDISLSFPEKMKKCIYTMKRVSRLIEFNMINGPPGNPIRISKEVIQRQVPLRYISLPYQMRYP